MTLSRRACAELIGTFWLVLGGCGSAVLASQFPGVGIGLLGRQIKEISLAKARANGTFSTIGMLCSAANFLIFWATSS